MPGAEDDYIERARELWRRYQFSVYVGLAMVLATIIGFTLSHSAYDEERRVVNEQLYVLMDSADDGQLEDAQAAHNALADNEEFPELGNLGAFVLSSLHFYAGDYAAAAAVLQRPLEDSADDGLRQLAALRIAEVHIADGENGEAVELLNDHMPDLGRLRIMFEERIGDAEFNAGNVEAAREAYERAIELALEDATFYVPVINIKLSTLLSGRQRSVI